MHSVLTRIFFTAIVFFFPIQSLCKEVPYLASRVNDCATMLKPETIQGLEFLLKSHEDSTSNQVVVLTIESLEGEVLEEYSIKVVDAWKLGTAKNDNGILLLVAKDDRKVRIEVGNGLEGILPDGKCGWIIRNMILPSFKAGDYDAGVMAGVAIILKTIKGEYHIDEQTEVAESSSDMPLLAAIGVSLFFLLVVGLFTMMGIFAEGAGSWFLFVFLIPFWTAFPIAIWGMTAGLIIFGCYVTFFIGMKYYLAKSVAGKVLHKKWSKRFASSSGGSSYRSGGSSSSSSSSSSSFSGGGGSFSGGGASGSW